MPVRIFIADDDQTIRQLLKRLLEAHRSDWAVCGEADNGRDAVILISELCPDVAILDLAMPGMTGLQAAQELSGVHPCVPMLLVSVQQVTKQLEDAARQAGFRGAVVKSSGSEVVKGVEALLRNQKFFVFDDSRAIA
jgi:DNA-binding NarL/FixJ family response regulator